VVRIGNFTLYYSLTLKQARVALLRNPYPEPLQFFDVDFGDTAVLGRAFAATEFNRIIHLGAEPGARGRTVL